MKLDTQTSFTAPLMVHTINSTAVTKLNEQRLQKNKYTFQKPHSFARLKQIDTAKRTRENKLVRKNKKRYHHFMPFSPMPPQEKLRLSLAVQALQVPRRQLQRLVAVLPAAAIVLQGKVSHGAVGQQRNYKSVQLRRCLTETNVPQSFRVRLKGFPRRGWGGGTRARVVDTPR